MTEPAPRLVVWTDHALLKAQMLGFALTDVEEAWLGRQFHRAHKAAAADWLIRSGGLAVAYDYAVDDELTALIVALWRQG
jgi:hypothetical protein